MKKLKKYKPFSEINFGSRDASDYTNSDKREFFDRIFVQDKKMDTIKEGNKYFIIGDKGTGKTAYPVYMQNHSGNNAIGGIKCFSRVVEMKSTDYESFMRLKSTNQLTISAYTDIWKLILLLLMSNEIILNKEDESSWNNRKKFSKLKSLIDQYYNYAFSPEIAATTLFIEDYKENYSSAIKLFQTAELGENSSSGTREEIQNIRIQRAVPYLSRQFSDAISELKVKNQFTIFIDGIDIRPDDIPFDSYIECIRGLTEAVWSLNVDYLKRDKNLRNCKFAVCIRPDIFDKLSLHNMNAKLHDNSVIMDWQVSYDKYADSSLFKLADRLLKYQQDTPTDYEDGECWNYYFNYTIPSKYNVNGDNSFIDFLRYSFYRPRDILEILRCIQSKIQSKSSFERYDFLDRHVQSEYSKYLLGEIKDSLAIYNSTSHFELFLSFFTFVKSHIDPRVREISYEQINEALEKFSKHVLSQNEKLPLIFNSGLDIFLQKIYELNIIGYWDKSDTKKIQHWYFKERSYTNINPQVGISEKIIYKLHIGIAKALKVID